MQIGARVNFGDYPFDTASRRVEIRPAPDRSLPPKRNNHGRFMTLCIAAVARDTDRDRENHTIVTVSDFMMSTQQNSMESTLAKVVQIGHKNKWLQLYSGDPSVQFLITKSVNLALLNTPEVQDDIINAYQCAFKEELKNKIEDELLSPYGMTREQFIREGRIAFGDEEYVRIIYKMNHIGLETEFLVTGFAGKRPHIFSFSDPGTKYVHDASGYYAIGCGASLADAWLINAFHPFYPLNAIIYTLAEAKFRSEDCPGVGKNTYISTLDNHGNYRAIHPTLVTKIREIWEREGKPSIPQEAVDLISDLLHAPSIMPPSPPSHDTEASPPAPAS